LGDVLVEEEKEEARGEYRPTEYEPRVRSKDVTRLPLGVEVSFRFLKLHLYGEARVHKDTRQSIRQQWMQKVYIFHIMCIDTYEYVCVSNMEARVHNDTRNSICQQWMQEV